MITKLPKDLKEAEISLNNSIIESLSHGKDKLMSIKLLFENLRLNPVIKRLGLNLKDKGIYFYLVWADEGASALAKRDMPEFSDEIYSYSNFKNNIDSLDHESLFIAVKPEPFDFDTFKDLCDLYSGRILMVNGRLEDLAVGIGNLGRERRKEFIYLWKIVFWLQPLSKGALMKIYGSSWYFFRLDTDGYRLCKSFDKKPDEEQILESLQNN